MNVGSVPIDWRWVEFPTLTANELYACLRLRQEVFVIEQDCPYLDADGLDLDAWHLLGYHSCGELIAYLRAFAPGVFFSEIAIGRVIAHRQWRGQGVGRQVFTEGLRRVANQFPNHGVRISAQQRLVRFYRESGFEPVGEMYLEDGIPHVEMLRADL